MIDRKIFFDGVREAFHAQEGFVQSQVDGLTYLLDRLERDERMQDRRYRSSALANLKHETGHEYVPNYERGPRSYFNRYNGRYGNTGPNDGFLYRGAGYIHLTFKDNYRMMSREIGVDLVTNPELAVVPEHAYEVMVVGMIKGLFRRGHSLPRYFNDETENLRHAFHDAREIINGWRYDKYLKRRVLDAAEKVRDYSLVFYEVLGRAEKVGEL